MTARRFVLLLRGINVGGANKLPMAELRALCGELGWADVCTYIQSGNVVARADAGTAEMEDRLERAIADRFGLSVAVIARTAAEWPAYLAGNPFPEASRLEPNRVMMALSKAAPRADALAVLQERAVKGERVARVGDAIWIHYADGVADSKLFPGMLDRAVGSPVTTRNWRTVLKLAELAGGGTG